MKKKVLVLSLGVFIALTALIAIPKANATGILERTILRATTILGISVPKYDSMRFVMVDAKEDLNDQQVTLPTLSGNDGMLYTVRYIDDGERLATVVPHSGQKLEGQTDLVWHLGVGQKDEAITFVADSSTNSWWIVSQAPFVWDYTQ